LTFPCYLTTFSGKKCSSGKVICAFFVPLIEVLLYSGTSEMSKSQRSHHVDVEITTILSVILPFY
jgi:hypothetical protein